MTTKWNTLRARFPDDEFNEIERIKVQYGLSYNEIIRSGVKFYVGLTLAKELVADALEEKDIKVGGTNLGEILNSPEYQGNLEQKISQLKLKLDIGSKTEKAIQAYFESIFLFAFLILPFVFNKFSFLGTN